MQTAQDISERVVQLSWWIQLQIIYGIDIHVNSQAIGTYVNLHINDVQSIRSIVNISDTM